MEFNKRNSVISDLNEFCHLSREEDYIEITEWSNGEGFDVNISDRIGDRTVPMTSGTFKALKKLVKALDKEREREWKERKKDRIKQ